MTRLKWDETGKRYYETGVDQVVLYPVGTDGTYMDGVAWNGVTQIDESPSGGEPTPIYANNGVYLNLLSTEKHGGTINAYTYPDEFADCDGSATLKAGVKIGQQTRKAFGLAYRTIKGNDTELNDHGYILHIVYGCLASPSSKSHSTVNESTEAATMSWTFNCTPVAVTGFKPTATITIDTTVITEANLKKLEDKLYGSDSASGKPTLPLPDEILTLLGGSGA